MSSTRRNGTQSFIKKSADEKESELILYMKKGSIFINRILNRNHEYVAPKFTRAEREKFGMQNEYGGITGTLRPGAFVQIAQVLLYGVGSEHRLVPNKSIFLDIGSGTGRCSLYFGCLPLKACVGFDIDPLQVEGSQSNIRQIQSHHNSPLLCPSIATFHHDVTRVETLEPVTHVFAFLGYPDIVMSASKLIAQSMTVVAFVAVVLHTKELINAGVLSNDSAHNEDIIVLPGLSMPGGNSYMAFVIPITEARRQRILIACADQDGQTIATPTWKFTFKGQVDKVLDGSFIPETMNKENIVGKVRRCRKRKAAMKSPCWAKY